MRFVKLSKHQSEQIDKACSRRAGKWPTQKLLKELRVSVIEQDPFTLVVLKHGAAEYYGFAKRCTYRGPVSIANRNNSYDEPNSEAGKARALKRAIDLFIKSN